MREHRDTVGGCRSDAVPRHILYGCQGLGQAHRHVCGAEPVCAGVLCMCGADAGTGTCTHCRPLCMCCYSWCRTCSSCVSRRWCTWQGMCPLHSRCTSVGMRTMVLPSASLAPNSQHAFPKKKKKSHQTMFSEHAVMNTFTWRNFCSITTEPITLLSLRMRISKEIFSCISRNC